MWVWSLGQEDLLEEEMATHSSILARIISQTGAWEAIVQAVAESQTWLSTHPFTICPSNISFILFFTEGNFPNEIFFVYTMLCVIVKHYTYITQGLVFKMQIWFKGHLGNQTLEHSLFMFLYYNKNKTLSVLFWQ